MWAMPERLNPPDEPPECYHGLWIVECQECMEREERMALDFYDQADEAFEQAGDR